MQRIEQTDMPWY